MRPVRKGAVVLELHSEPLGELSEGLRTTLARSVRLRVLVLNDCRLASLRGLPRLEQVGRLDLMYNQLDSSQLPHLLPLRALACLNLAFNRIGSVSGMLALASLPLRVADLRGNPLQREPSYRGRMARGLPGLLLLDGK
jgi:hypothetical protein